jgi:hypothetical protein
MRNGPPGCVERRAEIALGWSAGGREGRGFVGQIEVEEDGGDHGRIVRKARTLISPPHAGHMSGNTS